MGGDKIAYIKEFETAANKITPFMCTSASDPYDSPMKRAGKNSMLKYYPKVHRMSSSGMFHGNCGAITMQNFCNVLGGLKYANIYIYIFLEAINMHISAKFLLFSVSIFYVMQNIA